MEDQDARARAGLLFDAAWPGYRPMKARAHDLCRRYNALDELDPQRQEIIPQIFDEIGEGFYVRGPLQVNCGVHTRIGKRFFANFNVTILNDVPVTIGDDVVVGAGSIVTHDLPSGWLAVGSPARPVRPIDEADSVHSPGSLVHGRLSSEQRPAGAGSD
ncbi:maltose acetyltransferase domain-containing protein [Actinomyces faecalis]|uniref:maltose acetyltransferase domain-containing protein n=1 Tax=Actinomyces faecalis TaxID=2722820 RepID=UPI001555B3A5|nr:maltose acetyltransferase domain-containing protein [Actinomyces faecalis]